MSGDAMRAVEFGEYMAVSADRLMEALNAHQIACGETGEEPDPDTAVDAEESLSDALGGLRSAVYEFRKRKDRALTAPDAGREVPAYVRGQQSRANAVAEYTARIAAEQRAEALAGLLGAIITGWRKGDDVVGPMLDAGRYLDAILPTPEGAS